MTSSLRTIAGHRLVAGLGQGGMARVYLAISQKQLGFTKLVVLKVLRDELDVDGALLEMFIQEARLAARLNHPHVVQTYEAGEDDGRHYIAMEYLEGQALSSVIARAGGRLPLEAHLRILCDTLEGLQYVHDLTDYDGTPLGLVHRDVSPQNVFVTYSGHAKVIDFGIAKSFDSTRTVNGMLKGKIGYMAPEQARAGAVPDRRTDVFAVGVMLWEALAGRRLVERGEQEMMALGRRITGEEPKIRDVAPDAPPALADICDKAMAAEPGARFASAVEMRDALEACLAGRTPFDARQVALLLEETFAKERTRLRRLVDEKVKEAFDSGPLIDLHTEGTVTPPRGAAASRAEPGADGPSDGPTMVVTMNTAQTPAVVTPSARPRSAPLWAGLFVLAALATGFVLHRVERASTGRAQGVVSPTADAGDAPPATALPVASPIASAAPEIVDASPSVAIAVRAPAPKVSVAARPTSSARVTPVDTGAAKRGEAGGLRPLDGNPWETSK